MQIIGIDIGGTFTDVVALDVEKKITSAKTLTVRGDESSGVLACLSEIAVRQNAVERVVHGTTIGTNAILERRGAKTAILTTHGFRDLLEIGRTRRMAPNTLFDLSFRKPKPIVPRPLRFDVPERLNSAGEVLVALDDNVVVESYRPCLKRMSKLWPFASYTAMQTPFMKRAPPHLCGSGCLTPSSPSHAKSFLSTVNLNV